MSGRLTVVILGVLVLFSLTVGVGEASERRPPDSGEYLSIPPLEDGSRLQRSPVSDPPRDPPWIGNIKVSDDTATYSQNETSMGIFGNSLYLAWNDRRTGVYHVGFSYSTNLGNTWAPNQLLTEPTFPEQGDPVVAVDDSGYVYVGMLSFDRNNWVSDIYVVRSTDGGQTWGAPVLASANTPTSFEDKDWISANGESLYVTFASFATDVDIHFARSTDRGQTFLPLIRVNDNVVPGGRNGSMPKAGPGGEIYVSWGMDDRTYPDGIYIAKSTDGGASFGPNVRVADQYFTWASSPWRMTGIPAMTVSQTNGDVYIIWNDTTYGSLDVFFSRSTDGGATFSLPTVVNDNPPGDPSWQFMPWVEVDPYGDIHVVWYDTRSGGLNLDVYYSRSTDRGQTFEPNLRVTDQATMGSSFIGDYIAVVADSIRAYCAWSDNRNFDQDVYFSKYGFVGVEELANSQIPMIKSQMLWSYPNPFTQTTVIRYQIPDVRRITLCVYDLSGRLVKTLVNQPLSTGRHRPGGIPPRRDWALGTAVSWDGRDECGRALPGGVYFSKLETGGLEATGKLILIR